MSQKSPISRPPRLRRFFTLFIFRVLPAALILGIIWSGVRVMNIFLTQYNDYAPINQRATAYQETATAISESASSSLNSIDDGIVLAQVFATNTPRGDEPAEEPTEQEVLPLATNTPDATADTQIPDVEIPTLADPAMRTAVPLPTLIRPQSPDADVVSVTAIPTQVPLIERNYELVNILLLGGDDELTQDNFPRTDTMIVVSVNLDTGTVSMLSFPRDLFVWIPSGTMQRMNTAFSIGESIGWTDGGFGLLRQTIFYNFGINVHYYARVNFTGFEQIIDTLGGVEVAVDCAYQDYYPVEDIDLSRPIEENYYLRTLPVGYYEMNGFDALWYARTRRVADDFDRGRRQQQILRAIYRKARDTGQLANFPSLWNQVLEVVETNIPLDVAIGLLPIALNLEPSKIENFTLIRTYHTTPWQPPSGDFVQLPVYEPIQQLLDDFYNPPTQSQVELSGPLVYVYNGTTNADWDLVAADRLQWEGFNAVAAGAADEKVANSILIDKIAEEKGSVVLDIRTAMNIRQDNVRVEPDPNREADYIVIVGDNYDSCTGTVVEFENQ